MIRQMAVPCEHCGFDPNTLTAREKEVERYLTTTAMDLYEIADKMGIAMRTVDAHKVAVFRKNEVHSRVALILKLNASK